MASNACHIVEAALKQMDEMIAGKSSSAHYLKNTTASFSTDPRYMDPALKALQLTEALKALLEGWGSDREQESVRKQVATDTADVIPEWECKCVPKVNSPSTANSESYQQRLSRLEGDKESLILQVSVLTDQVEAQGAKISDLQSSLVEHRQKLRSTGEMLQQEFLHRTSLESQKLSLMGEVSYLKLKLSDMEGKQGYGAERQHKAENFTKELRILKEKVEHLEDQKLQYEKKLKATKVEVSSLQQLVLTKNAEIEGLHAQLLTRPSSSAENSEKDKELQRLRIAMKSLLAANDEKDRRIEELTLLLNQCRQFREVTHNRPAPPTVGTVSNGRTSSTSSEEEMQESMKRTDSTSAKSEDLKSEQEQLLFFGRCRCHMLLCPALPLDTRLHQHRRTVTSEFTEIMVISCDRTETPTSPDLRNRPSEKSCLSDSKHQPGNSSLSHQNGRDSSGESQSQRSPDGSEDGDSSQSKSSQISSGSTAVLREADDSMSSSDSPVQCDANMQSSQRSVGSPEYLKTNRSFRRLWGKLRRTQSGGFQAADPETGPFKRGGLRATAGPRLTRTPEASACSRDMSIPFSQWTKEQVCGWLEDFGLGHYVNLTRHWVESGQTLLSASPQDFEREMRMRNPLHRKKLQLALRAFSTKTVEKSSELDYIWVARWLDDIGLPQYKDQFHEARVDGRMIQYLTVNDLLTLKVTSQLHHLSIKCAIHVLHANKFNPNCLRRRPGEERDPSPSEVVQWSNHRVMEWLRSVDLAEFAPNLRGSGVHGGLIILEPRFNSETLALLLSIPPQKTLLRRHLATAFSALVGLQAAQEKREYANATGHVPLTTTAKVKPKKLGFTQFSHLRKRKQDDSLDYICPIDTGVPAMNGASPPPSAGPKGLSSSSNRQAERQEEAGTGG
uniref:PPFIA binding protein 2a n=1 Tax=Tetraodon nigroviridis TaxID=99883 RepID=H3D8H7_TETNG